MKNLIRKDLFSYTVILLTLSAFIVVLLLKHYTNYITQNNVHILSLSIKTFFLLSFFLILVYEYLKNNTFNNIFRVKNLLIFSIIALLVLSIFRKDIGIYATGFYVLSVLIYFSLKRELFEVNKIFYVIFIYAIFELIGTVNTPQGLHFPEMTYSLYIIPLTYSFFKLEKQTLLRIQRTFFRVILIYIGLSLVYWFFNFECFDVSFVEWTTKKIGVAQAPVYEFITKWSDYTHPSYITLVLLSALISGFYLFYKNEKGINITAVELITFIVGCVLLEFVLESRIGILEIFAVTILSVVYYVRIKTPYFKFSVLLVSLFVVFLSFFAEKHFSGMMGDDVRKADYTLAINYIKNHPWWGSGYHQQREALLFQDKIMKNVNRPVTAKPITYTHNQFLGNMVQYGIPGLIILILLIVALFRYAFRTRSYLLQMLLVIYLMFMFIEEPFYVQEGITRFTVFFCFFVAIADVNKKNIKLRNWLSKS